MHACTSVAQHLLPVHLTFFVALRLINAASGRGLEEPPFYGVAVLRERIGRAGRPAHSVAGGSDLLTIEPAATVQSSPISTPFRINAPSPIQARSPIRIGRGMSRSPRARALGSMAWPWTSMIVVPDAM